MPFGIVVKFKLFSSIGDWHPLAAEKILALALNVGNDTEVFAEGYLTIPGLHGIRCANNTQ